MAPNPMLCHTQRQGLDITDITTTKASFFLCLVVVFYYQRLLNTYREVGIPSCRLWSTAADMAGTLDTSTFRPYTFVYVQWAPIDLQAAGKDLRD